MNQKRAPIFEALERYVKKRVVKLHIPGHKYGVGLPKEMKVLLGGSAAFDLSVLEDIDSLSHPESAIKDAQKLAALAFGADETLFTVNGSTMPIIAMILGMCGQGEKIIINRNAHQSVIAGLSLSGAGPEYILPEYDENFGFPLSVTPLAVQESLKKNSSSKAVLITSPSQFGVTADLKKIANIVHSAGKILIVDEAWGAHLKFHPDFPASALDSGADVVVQSAHKRLPALSQTSFLHFKGGRVDREKIKGILRMLQTTSPSYILLASMDSARREMALRGERDWQNVLGLADDARGKIKNLGFEILERNYVRKSGFDLDSTHTVVAVENGFNAWKIFNKYKIEPEFAALEQLVLIFGMGNNPSDVSTLIKALKKISPKRSKEGIRFPHLQPKVVLSPKEAGLRKSKKIKIKKAVGRISAQIVTPYPPGIPLLVPGEIITREICEYLDEIKKYSSARMQVLGGSEEIKVII